MKHAVHFVSPIISIALFALVLMLAGVPRRARADTVLYQNDAYATDFVRVTGNGPDPCNTQDLGYIPSSHGASTTFTFGFTSTPSVNGGVRAPTYYVTLTGSSDDTYNDDISDYQLPGWSGYYFNLNGPVSASLPSLLAGWYRISFCISPGNYAGYPTGLGSLNGVTVTAFTPPLPYYATIENTSTLGLYAASSTASALVETMGDGWTVQVTADDGTGDTWLAVTDPVSGASGWAIASGTAARYITPYDASAQSALATNALARLSLGDLGQSVPSGASTTSSTVTLTAEADSSSSDPMVAQFEVRPFGQAFTGVPTATSGLVMAGGVASATIPNLLYGGYAWQARLVDASRTQQVTPWRPFAAAGSPNPDFFIVNQPDSWVLSRSGGTSPAGGLQCNGHGCALDRLCDRNGCSNDVLVLPGARTVSTAAANLYLFSYFHFHTWCNGFSLSRGAQSFAGSTIWLSTSTPMDHCDDYANFDGYAVSEFHNVVLDGTGAVFLGGGTGDESRTTGVARTNDVDPSTAKYAAWGCLSDSLVGAFACGADMLAASSTTASTTSVTEPPAKEPVVIVPGIMGTTLDNASTGQEIWPNVSEMLASDLAGNRDSYLSSLALGGDGTTPRAPVRVGHVIEEATGSIPFLGSEIGRSFYGTLANALRTDVPVFTVPYDWRMDIASQEDALAARIADAASSSPDGKVAVVAHSMGGLLVKKYLMDRPGASSTIGRLIFAGVPQLGTPTAFKALAYGDNLGISWHGISILDPGEAKAIVKNMSSVYELLPGDAYVERAGSYVNDFAALPGPVSLDRAGTAAFLARDGANAVLLKDASTFHTDLDNNAVDIPQFSEIIGCTVPTIAGFNEYAGGVHDLRWGLGDGTVTGAGTGVSAGDNIYYALGADHMGLVEGTDTVALIKALAEGTAPAGMELPASIATSSEKCATKPFFVISTHSPVALNVYNEEGSHTGKNASGSVDLAIPDGRYEEIGQDSFVAVPADGTYRVSIGALSPGSFILKVEEHGPDAAIEKESTYVAVPLVSSSTTASLSVSATNFGASLSLDAYGDGASVQEIGPTALLGGAGAQDIVPPVLTIAPPSIPSDIVRGSTTSIAFTWSDASGTVATSSATLNGIPFVSGETIAFNETGTSTIRFFAEDEAGNPAEAEYAVAVREASPAAANAAVVVGVAPGGGTRRTCVRRNP